MAEAQNFKCILVGDAFSGKSSFVRRFVSELNEVEFLTSKYVCPVLFSTELGMVCFNVYDTAGQEMFGGLRDSFFQKSDCAMIMFDLTAPNTFHNILFWYKRIKALNERIPIILCGNKVNNHFKQSKLTAFS